MLCGVSLHGFMSHRLRALGPSTTSSPLVQGDASPSGMEHRELLEIVSAHTDRGARAVSIGRYARRWVQARKRWSAATTRAMARPDGARNAWKRTMLTTTGARSARARG